MWEHWCSTWIRLDLWQFFWRWKNPKRPHVMEQSESVWDICYHDDTPPPPTPTPHPPSARVSSINDRYKINKSFWHVWQMNNENIVFLYFPLSLNLTWRLFKLKLHSHTHSALALSVNTWTLPRSLVLFICSPSGGIRASQKQTRINLNLWGWKFTVNETEMSSRHSASAHSLRVLSLPGVFSERTLNLSGDIYAKGRLW